MPFLNKIFQKSKPAFSIIEMVVSVAIIILISGIFLANYRNNVRRSDLSMTTNILAADTRLAQSYSLGLVKYDNVFPDGGWGIDLDLAQNDRYFFFADGYDNLADYQRQDNESLAEYKGKTVVLPADIRIQKIRVNVGGDWEETNHLAVTFTPPSPKTIIYNVDASEKAEEAIVTLVNTKDNSTMNLLVNFVGLIDTSQ